MITLETRNRLLATAHLEQLDYNTILSDEQDSNRKRGEMKDSFVFYRSFYESTKGLPDESRLRLFDNICELALNGKDIDGLHGIEINIFTLIKPQIEANNQRYENGKKGGRPTKKTNGYKREKTIGYEIEKPNVNVNDNENVNVNDNENENDNKKKVFKKPTLEEIETYCKERNNNVDSKSFFDFYEAGDWKDSKGNKVKNWKQKIITWERDTNKKKDKQKEIDDMCARLAYLDEEK